MIAWLQTLPHLAEVKCGVEEYHGGEISVTMQPVDIDECDILDYTSEKRRVEYPNMAGRVIVLIHGTND